MRAKSSWLGLLGGVGLLIALWGCRQPSARDPAGDGGAKRANIMSVHTNRLAREKSPYLLQHQHNPVDWYAWGDAAFARARADDKPIFLSIGYSTCHWCHVMERESFESAEVAAFLNAHFVAIKVDREERPDVDKIYMTFVQATSGQGGWPLNVFLAPDLKPFFGGTYFPPDGRGGRPGFLQLLRQIERLWATRRGDVEASSTEIHERLTAFARDDAGGGGELTAARLESAARVFQAEYDPRHGGFGGAPKFPRPTQPAFVLRQGVRTGDAAAVRMVLHTCDAMAAGGMYDQLGGGFHRYSVDAEWRVPHFEKMLYDNAQLVQLYLDAHLVSGEARHAAVAADILRYVLRDLTHPDGGFYSAEDADSEGHEGKFYCWTRAELAAVLSPEEFTVVRRHYGITDAGNFVDHSHPTPLAGQNVLCVVDPELSDAERTALDSARAKLLQVRSRRVRPHCDDKILASWNGLMLGALARAGRVLDDPVWLAAAERNLAFLEARMWDADARQLHHRWRDGERDAVQLLDAYAFLLSGVLELYQATLNGRHLEFAVTLADAMIERFHDATAGGFYQSAGTADLILRLKEDYDGAEPSGNSVAVQALLRLAAITDRAAYRQVAERTLQRFAPRLEQLPQAVPNLLLALDYWLEAPRRVVLTGDLKTAAGQRLLGAAHRVYQPNKVILGQAGPVERFAVSLPAGAEPTAYVCTGTACQPPTSDPEALQARLR